MRFPPAWPSPRRCSPRWKDGKAEEDDRRYDIGDAFQGGIPRVVGPAYRLEHRPYAVREDIVGMGGAGFPTRVKLSPKEPEKIEYIIANLSLIHIWLCWNCGVYRGESGALDRRALFYTGRTRTAGQ